MGLQSGEYVGRKTIVAPTPLPSGALSSRTKAIDIHRQRPKLPRRMNERRGLTGRSTARNENRIKMLRGRMIDLCVWRKQSSTAVLIDGLPTFSEPALG